MWGRLKTLTTTGLLACFVAACSGPDLSDLEDLPVRTTPQSQAPHSEADPNAPLRGTAVAVDVATAT